MSDSAPTVRLLLFAAAREAAGTARAERQAATLGDLVDGAIAAYGEHFAAVVATARIWVNGDEPAAGRATRLAPGDEVAVLPPVSGGCDVAS